MKLRQIAVILFILFSFSTIFFSPAGAEKSIRFELTAEFIKTEYVNGIPEDNPSIYTTTRVFGDFGYEGNFDRRTGEYLVKEDWLDTQFNIQNHLEAKADLHPTLPQLTNPGYHFVQDDQDVGNYYYLDYRLFLTNNIEIPLISNVGDTPLEFRLTGEDVCNNVFFNAYKNGGYVTHHDVVEINDCDDDSLLKIILEVDDSFWDGNPKVKTSPYSVNFRLLEWRKPLEIRNVGSGDLLISDIDVGGYDADRFFLENKSNCTFDIIGIDEACTVDVVYHKENTEDESHAWLKIHSNSITSPDTVSISADEFWFNPVGPIIQYLLGLD